MKIENNFYTFSFDHNVLSQALLKKMKDFTVLPFFSPFLLTKKSNIKTAFEASRTRLI